MIEQPMVDAFIAVGVVAGTVACVERDRGDGGWWVHLVLGPGACLATALTGCPLFLLFTAGWAVQLLGRLIHFVGRSVR